MIKKLKNPLMQVKKSFNKDLKFYLLNNLRQNNYNRNKIKII